MYDQQNKLIGYLIMAIVAYGILSALVPYLVVAVVGLIVWRIIEAHNKRGRR